MNDSINIALLQILPTGSIEQNMEKGVRCCKEASARGADIALFPEMWSSGYAIPHDAEKLNALAVPADGEFVMRFGLLAKELEMAIGITFLEKGSVGLKNSICLFDRHGHLVYKYSKVHICDFGEPNDESVLCAGDEFPVAALDTAKGDIKVGSMICYDREFPESAASSCSRARSFCWCPTPARWRSTACPCCGAVRMRICSPSPPAIIPRPTRTATAALRCLTVWRTCRSCAARGIPAYWRPMNPKVSILPGWTSPSTGVPQAGSAKSTEPAA